MISTVSVRSINWNELLSVICLRSYELQIFSFSKLSISNMWCFFFVCYTFYYFVVTFSICPSLPNAADPKLPLVATRHYLIFGWKVIHMNYTYERAVSCDFPENIPYQSWRTVVQLSQKFSKLFLNRLLKLKATFWTSALTL